MGEYFFFFFFLYCHTFESVGKHLGILRGNDLKYNTNKNTQNTLKTPKGPEVYPLEFSKVFLASTHTENFT